MKDLETHTGALQILHSASSVQNDKKLGIPLMKGEKNNPKKSKPMTQIFKVTAQSETFSVPSQKAEGGQISKCNVVLQEPGGKFENSYVATILGEQAKIRFAKDDLVVASLRFSTREYNGQMYQDIVVSEIVRINK